MVTVVKHRAFKDAMRRRMWELLLSCGHVQYEFFEEFRRPPKEVSECRVCECLKRSKRFRETGETTYKKKPVVVQQTLW